jgi:acyl dehydratase
MKYFEDVQVGDVMRFGRYEVTREEIVEYARQFDPQPFHLDEEAAKASMFGGLIASGWHTGAMFIRMVVEHMTPVHATSGAMGFDDLKWIRPVRPGDVLSVESGAPWLLFGSQTFDRVSQCGLDGLVAHCQKRN